MTVTMDKFGRILIPKKIRQLAGLEPGTDLEIFVSKESGNMRLIPKPPPSKSIIITEFGLPVVQYDGPINEDFDTVAFMKETREQYLDRKMGL